MTSRWIPCSGPRFGGAFVFFGSVARIGTRRGGGRSVARASPQGRAGRMGSGRSEAETNQSTCVSLAGATKILTRRPGSAVHALVSLSASEWCIYNLNPAGEAGDSE